MSIIWIDTETTGLEPQGEVLTKGRCPQNGHSEITRVTPGENGGTYEQMGEPDRVLEVAVIVTDDALRELARASWVTSEARMADIRHVSPEVREMHNKNGLWCESLASPFSIAQVDEACALLIERAGAKGAPIAGNTIRFDREMLRRWMPRTLSVLHYRDINVSTLNEMAQRFWPEVYKGRPQGAVHRAMPDVVSSIAQTRYYLTSIGPHGFVTAQLADGGFHVGNGTQNLTTAHK